MIGIVYAFWWQKVIADQLGSVVSVIMLLVLSTLTMFLMVFYLCELRRPRRIRVWHTIGYAGSAHVLSASMGVYLVAVTGLFDPARCAPFFYGVVVVFLWALALLVIARAVALPPQRSQ